MGPSLVSSRNPLTLAQLFSSRISLTLVQLLIALGQNTALNCDNLSDQFYHTLSLHNKTILMNEYHEQLKKKIQRNDKNSSSFYFGLRCFVALISNISYALSM